MEATLSAGIIGCGNITLGGHAPVLKALGTTRVVGIADPTTERRQKMQSLLDLPDSACFSDYRELLAAGVDYVVVATPQRFRRAIIEDCARAGVHVLSEKPIATVPADAAAMVAAARAAGIRYGMVHNYLYYPEYILSRRLIDDGAVGKVRHVTLNFLGVPDHPGAQEYRPWWRHDPLEAGGGILMDMIHAVYLVEYLMGEPIQAVSAVVDNLDHGDAPVEDFTLVHLHFASDYATINMWWGNGPGGLEMAGTAGRIMVFYENFGTGPFTELDSFTLVNGDGRREFQPREAGGEGQFTSIHRDFADAIRSGRDPIAPAAAGARALEATLAAYASAATGRVITLPFSAEYPVFQAGVGGLKALDVRRDGPLARKGVFGLESTGAD